jgi:acetyl esterase/lipase
MSLLLAEGCSPLRTFNALIPKDRGGRQVAEGVVYAAQGQKLDVYAPAERGAARLPVIVFFYGGSWNSGTRRGYVFVGRALASRGFVVVIPDYRQVPLVRYPAFVQDGAAAVRWTIGHVADFGGDPRRIVLAGHSAGAYIAAMLAVDERWLGKDRINVRGLIGLAGPYDFAPFDVPASQEAFGEWPDPAETQPVTWAGQGDPHALLMIGEQDKTVMPRNSEALALRLNAGGSSAHIIRYPGLGHIGMLTALARPLRGKANVLGDIADFSNDVTGL